MHLLTISRRSKAQVYKMIQSGGFLRHVLSNSGEKVITNLATPITIDNLPGLVSNLSLNTRNKFERKKRGKGAARAGKRFTLFISKEDINYIIKSLEDSETLIDGITETVKH